MAISEARSPANMTTDAATRTERGAGHGSRDGRALDRLEAAVEVPQQADDLDHRRHRKGQGEALDPHRPDQRRP